MTNTIDVHGTAFTPEAESSPPRSLSQPIDLVIAFPKRLTCSLMGAALRTTPNINLVGYATTLPELEDKLSRANFLIVGHTLTERDATPALELLEMFDHPIKTLVVDVPDDPDVIIAYLECGASGYIDADLNVDDLIDIINRALQDELITTPDIAALMAQRLSELSTLCGDVEALALEIDKLTRREQEVLQRITQGAGNGTIAKQLGIEVGTVKNHVHNILSKLELRSRHEAALLYRHFLDSHSG